MGMYWTVWYRASEKDQPTLERFLESVVGAPFSYRSKTDGALTAIGEDCHWDLMDTDPALDDEELHLGDFPVWLRIRPRYVHSDSHWARDEARRIFEASRTLGLEVLLMWDVLEVVDRIEPP